MLGSMARHSELWRTAISANNPEEAIATVATAVVVGLIHLPPLASLAASRKVLKVISWQFHRPKARTKWIWRRATIHLVATVLEVFAHHVEPQGLQPNMLRKLFRHQKSAVKLSKVGATVATEPMTPKT